MKKIKVFGPNCWMIFVVFALIICVDIEFGLFLIPCCSSLTAQFINEILLTLSYSYISAAIFHMIVNVIPKEHKRRVIQPLLNHLIFSVKEKIRLCKNIIIPFCCVSCEDLNKDKYAKLFKEANLHKDSIIGGKTKLNYLNELRGQIITIAYLVLSYREYLSDKQFQYINSILQSIFIVEGIHPNPNLEDAQMKGYYGSNQYEIGECIYELFESSKLI